VGYLTLSAIPTGTTCRVLFIPDSEEALAIVRGALQLLTFPEMWDKFGATTTDESAAAFVSMFDRFCFDEGNCRMVGEIIAYAGSTSPSPKMLVCDGSSLLRADYPDLFNVIGVTYGAIDSSHFNIPDLRGRVGVGSGSGSGLTSRTNGQTFGEEEHQLTGLELASHSHTDSGHTHVEGTAAPTVGAAITGVPVPSAIPSVGTTGLGFSNISSSGGDNPHNNVQPSLVLTYLIVATDG